MTVVHLNGQTKKVRFDCITGDKLDNVSILWPMAGCYGVDLSTGQLIATGKARLPVSLWKVVDADMARIRATQRKLAAERKERLRKNKRSNAK